ncbi:hypothetical protein IKE67_08865 [bacterium]|nr:hypothetical protein [bacterium]
MWKTNNYKGESVTWYSEEEYTILEQENQEAKEIIAELEYKIKTLQTKNPGIMTNSWNRGLLRNIVKERI